MPHPRQFYMRPMAHVVYLGIFVAAPLILGVWLELNLGQDTPGIGLITAGIVIAIGLAIYLPFIWYQRLILTDEGIMVRALGSTLRTEWGNIERLYRGIDGHAGLVTRTAMSGRAVERLRRDADLGDFGGQPWYHEAERAWCAEGRYLPLKAFNHTLAHGRLQAALAHHLPALEGLHDPAEERTPAERQRRRRAIWLILALSLGLCLITVVLALGFGSDSNSSMGGWLGFGVCALAALRTLAAAVSNWRAGLRIMGVILALLAFLVLLIGLVFLDQRPA